VTSPVRTPPEAESTLEFSTADGHLERMRALHAQLGDIYRVYAPRRRGYVYVINHPDDVKRVLLSNHANYGKGYGFDRIQMLLGNGLVTSEGEFWRTQRHMMQPMFHRQVVTQFGAIIDAANDRLLERLRGRAAQGEPINVTSEMSKLTLDVMLRAVFGSDADRLQQQMAQNPFEMLTQETGRDLSFAARFYQLRKLVKRLVRQRFSDQTEHFDFVGMLMAAREKISGAPMAERAMIDEVMTLIVAGHETAASGLNSTWYLLSQHPAVEAKLHAEIDSFPADSVPSLSASESLVYTRSVVSEALRLYPPVWLLSRRALGPDVLAGYEIPADSNVLLSPYLVHRHPKFWNNPEAFDPDRVESKQGTNNVQFARIPFSAGPRHCIGETLALYEMCIHLFRVARRYRLRHAPAQRLELEAHINLRSKYPVLMGLEPRCGQ
jgi:cytochrome P450